MLRFLSTTNIQIIILDESDSKNVYNFKTQLKPKPKYHTRNILEVDVKKLLSILEIKILQWHLKSKFKD